MGRLREEYQEIPWIALTATAPKKVKDDLVKKLSLKNVKSFQVSCFRTNLYYDVQFKSLLKDDFIELKSYIDSRLLVKDDENLKDSEKPCGIIYCRKKETTELVARSLRKLGLKCAAFNSSLKKSEKETVQDDWMNGKCPVIVATVSFGMGIDKGSVRFVIHWDVPQSISNWYQESGRAGRDGKKSFCRVYYDRDEVRTMSFLLQQEVNKKSKNEEQQKVAKQSLEEFVKISKHCEDTKCRHKLFTDFFGDPGILLIYYYLYILLPYIYYSRIYLNLPAPKCDKMCDSCKDKKLLQKKIEEFEMVCNRASHEKFNKIPDQDFSDLYEGGKKNGTVSGSFEDYEGSGETSGFQTAKETYAKQQRDFIQKQFALRKAKAAEAIQNIPTAQISRVKKAMSTELKVSGLKSVTRESSLDFIVDNLIKNKEKAEGLDPSQILNHELKRTDFEDIAKDIEYNIFSNCQAISVYRMKISKTCQEIRNLNELHKSTKEHIPKQRQSFGGDYDTMKKDIKERFGEDVVQELESEQAKKTERKKKDKFAQFGRDGLNQTKIESFFNPNRSNKKTSATEQPKESESSIVANVEDETIEIDDPLPPPLEVKLECKSQKRKESKSEGEKSFSLEERIAQLQKSKNVPVKIEVSKDEDHRHVDKQSPQKQVKRKLDDEIIESSPKRKRENHNIPKDISKTTISEHVVAELNKHYKEQRFRSDDPRSLFKNVARTITHQCISLNLSGDEIKSWIRKLFKIKKVIQDVQDVYDAISEIKNKI